jgi:hypothetical protein
MSSSGGQQTPPSGPETTVEVSAQAQYNSNIAGSDEQIAAQRGLKLADVIFEPGLDFTVARQIGRPLLYLRGNVNYAYSVVNTFRSRTDFAVDGGGTGHFGPCQEDLTGSYAHTQSALSEVARGVINNIVSNANVSFDARCGRQSGLTPTLSVQQSWLSNSSKIESFVDNRTLNVDAGVGYTRPAVGTLSLFGNYSTATYPNRRFAVLNPNTGPSILVFGYDIYGGGIRFERPVGARISVLASLSYTSLQGDLPGAVGFHGITYSADVTYAVTPHLSTHVEAVHATQPSNRPGSNFALRTTYEADATYQLGSRYTVEVSAQYENLNYPGSNPLVTDDLTDETTYTGMISVNYKLTRRIRLGLTTAEESRSANFPGLSFDATKVTLNAVATF